MDFSQENLEKVFPYYLTEERKKGILQELQDISICRYYSVLRDKAMHQGDGWRGIPILRFDDGKREYVQALVISNSCDISPHNPRLRPISVNFAPLIVLSKYLEALRRSAISEERIRQHAQDIRDQSITDIFYLPSEDPKGLERIALLSSLHTVPMSALDQVDGVSRLFSLSNAGFFLFIFKLSIHLCRLHENVDRDAAQ